MFENTPKDCGGPEDKAPKVSLMIRLLRRLGIELAVETSERTVTQTKEQRFWRASFRPRFFTALLVMAGLAVVALAGSSWYSTKPSFCNNCHIMEPYYNAWAGSNHRFVRCVDCHYPPGKAGDILWHKFQALSQVVKYVTRTYSSKPFAEIPDESCLRAECHSNRLLQGRVLSQSGIFFDHKPHLEKARYGQQLRCVSCHSQIVIGTHMEVTWDTCYLCHLMDHKGERKLEPIGGCRGCHLVPDKEINITSGTFVHKDYVRDDRENCQDCHLEIMKGDGEVSKSRCLTCHNQPEKLARFEETDFLHDNHVTKHHIACFHCHSEIRHGYTIKRELPEMVSDCQRCHANLHDLEGDLYRGKGAKGIEDVPSPMYSAGVDCSACHLNKQPNEEEPGHAFTYAGSEVGCGNCHGPEFLEMPADAQAMIKETVDRLKQKMALVAEAMKTSALDAKTMTVITEKLGEADHNLQFVESTHGPHNIYYTANALEYSERVITAAAKKFNVTETERTSALPIISGTYCAALCHNRLGISVPPKNIKFNNMDVAHERHIAEGLSCRVCHDFGAHKNVKFKGPEVCQRCHSEDQIKKWMNPGP